MKTIKELMQELMLSTYDGIKIDTLKEVLELIDEDTDCITIETFKKELKARIEG